MKSGSIIEEDGSKIDIVSQLTAKNTSGGFFGHRNNKTKIALPSEQIIDKVTNELGSPYVSYDDVALTKNGIVSLNNTTGSEGLFTYIGYKDVVWIYEAAPDTALVFTLYKALSGSIEDLPDTGMRMYLFILSKDKKIITIPDHKTYYRRGRLSRKVSKNFDKFKKILIERCPSDTLIGNNRENKIKYLKKIGEEIPQELLDEPRKPWYSEPQDEDDLI